MMKIPNPKLEECVWCEVRSVDWFPTIRHWICLICGWEQPRANIEPNGGVK